MNKYCVCCCERFRDGDIEHQSSLYGAERDHFLCSYCASYEERMIEEKGTNDIPELLHQYRKVVI